ncbi:MAG: BMP family ABC transporter substrate-binding protein, partial [Chloroflexi bacterium]|nr:BMP family ABC transporter substrate-binding protein [Chloroflexota bacterium]
FVFVACAPAPTPTAVPTAVPPTKAPEPTKAPAATVAPTTAPAATKAPEPTKAPAATTAPTVAPTTAAARPFRIAVIMPSAVNDLAFSQSMYDALLAVQKEMGGKDKLDFAYTDNMFNVPDAAAAVRDYASKGFDLVIAHGSQYGASLADIAPDFPKTSFAWGTAVDTFASKGVKNIHAYTVLADQGGYAMGVMAAKLSKTNKFGLIGPVPAGDGLLHINGFEAGIKATNPNATISKTFTQSFSDAALMSQAAQTMLTNGADMFTGTSQAVVGAISVLKDKNAAWFGNQAEQVKLAPKNVVATQVYDWTPFVKQLIDNTKAGKLGGEVMTGTLKNKVLVVKYNPDYAIPADVKKLADDTVQGLIDGKIQTGVK